MALPHHIMVARTQGPKAGYTSYIETLERSGLDTAKASLAEIRKQGNKKAQFDFYCAKFGKKFGATPERVDESEDLAEQLRVLQARLAELQEQGIGVVVTATEDEEFEDEDTSLDDVPDIPGVQIVHTGNTAEETQAGESLIQRALGKGKRTRRSSGSKPKPSTQPKESKENLWRPWAVARFGIPMQVGGTFTYVSKRAKKPTVHQVTRITEDGVYAKRVK